MFSLRLLVTLAATLSVSAVRPSGQERFAHQVHSSALPFKHFSDREKVGDSYAGHIVVRKTPSYEAGLFYWYFRAEQNAANAPLIVWIQGGPGGSSVQDGLFFEMGPLRVFQEQTTGPYLENVWRVRRNPHSWTTKYNMIFLDQPVGTGFSYVDPPAAGVMSQELHTFWTQHLLQGRTHVHNTTILSDAADRTHPESHFHLVNQNEAVNGFSSTSAEEEPDFKNGYAANEDGVSKDFITFMNSFYDIFPETRKLSLHLTSESYGGKYVPSIATAIARYNDATSDDSKKIPLTTLAIGNQWTDPSSQIPTHPAHFINIGLIDEVQATLLQEPISKALRAVEREDWEGGLQARSDMFSMLSAFTGGINWYDFRLGNKKLEHFTDPIAEYLLRNETQKLLHAEKKVFGTDPAVFLSLATDNMKSTLPLFPSLLKRYKLLVYQGHFDLRDGVTSNSAWIDRINWEGRVQFKYSQRKIWKNSEGDLQGYATQYANLTRVVLLGCGHLAPADDGCPASSLEMITRHIDQNEFL